MTFCKKMHKCLYFYKKEARKSRHFAKKRINAKTAQILKKCKNRILQKNKIDRWSGVNMLAFFRIFLVPPFSQDRMVDWIPSEGHNPEFGNIYAFFFGKMSRFTRFFVKYRHLCVFFGKMSRFTRFFVKYHHLCNFLAKYRDLRTLSSVPPKQSK